MGEKGGLRVFTLFLRGAVLYAVMILVMRGLGKRQLGELQPYELAMTILLADVISAPMESVSTPLLHGLLPVAAMFALHSAISLASMKWDWVRTVVTGRPAVVIRRGEVDQAELERLCLSLNDLLEGLRGAGFLDPAEVGTAIVEANGGISAFAAADQRGPKTSELGVSTDYEGLPLPLILAGRVQPANLRRAGRDAAWLEGLLSGEGLRAEDVYLAMLDTGGTLTLTLKGGGARSLRAMAAGEVTW